MEDDGGNGDGRSGGSFGRNGGDGIDDEAYFQSQLSVAESIAASNDGGDSGNNDNGEDHGSGDDTGNGDED